MALETTPETPATPVDSSTPSTPEPAAPEPTLLDAISKAVDPPKEPEPAAPDPEAEGEDKPEVEGKPAPVAETPEAKAAREAEEAKNRKPMDPLNDPIHQNASARTRERITSLVALVKDRDTKLAEHGQLFQEIQSTGVSPDSFAATLTTLRLFNSPKIEDKRQALTFLQQQVAHLAAEVGEILPGVDPLEGHQDLKDAVANLSITPEFAAEVAKFRAKEKASTNQMQHQTETQRQQATEFNNSRQTAITALNALGSTLSKVDPNYAAKYQAIVTKLKPEFEQMHPSQWVARFEQEYSTMQIAPPATPAAPATPAGPQPMRANKQPAGGGQKQATTLAEAVDAGLAAAAARR